MKRTLLIIAAAACLWQARAENSTWLTDLPTAITQAKAQDKALILDFTGSDWCPWCIKFRKEVLDSEEFQKYAQKNLVQVELDFPRKTTQDVALKTANAALKEKYQIKGFPTLVILDSKGNEIGRQEGYEDGGATAFIAKIEKFKSGKS